MLSLRSSPTHAMEALRHEHERDLVEVKGIAVWILNVLVDATRHATSLLGVTTFSEKLFSHYGLLYFL